MTQDYLRDRLKEKPVALLRRAFWAASCVRKLGAVNIAETPAQCKHFA